MTAVRVAIVGGGISGLATAYYLAQAGIDALLIEKSSRLGGLIRTDTWQGCALEAGPDSYLAAKPAVTELACELGALGDHMIGSNDELRRVFIVRAGNLVPLPKGMSMMAPGEWGPTFRSGLFSASAKLEFLRELSRRPRLRENDISVGEFVSDHFGREVLEYVAEPLLAGVYGGDPARLSAASVLPRFIEYEQRFGSLIRGVRRAKNSARTGSLFRSFRNGMQSLPDALLAAIDGRVRLVRGEVLAITRNGPGWSVRTAGETISAERVVLACPAHVSSSLLEKSAPGLAGLLAEIPYSSAILATLVYDNRDVAQPLGGAGLLVPKRERRTLAAATWINAKFPMRVAPGLIAVRAFVVGEEALRLETAPDPEANRFGDSGFTTVRKLSPGAKLFKGGSLAPFHASICGGSRSAPAEDRNRNSGPGDSADNKQYFRWSRNSRLRSARQKDRRRTSAD